MSTIEAPPSMSRPHPNQVLAIACVGVVLATLDLFIVSVALPSIGRDFAGASLDALSWILNGYAIVYASLLVFMGRLAERHRRDRSYLAGVALFTAASAGCAAAQDVWMLVAFRVLQATGAALMTPASLGLVLAAFAPAERGSAARIWTAVGGFAGALGPVAGGLLLTLSWHWIFLVNLPIGLAALAVGWRVLPKVPGHDVPRPDALGAALITLGVGAATFGLITAGRSGWTHPQALLGLVSGIMLTGAFALHCLQARNPLVEPSLFSNRTFAAAALGLAPFMVAFGAFLLSFVLWLQEAWGWSALRTGLTLAPGPFLVPLTSMFLAGRLIAKLGASAVIALGLTAFAAACAALALGIGLTPSQPIALGAAVLSGIGVGLALPTLFGTAAGALPSSAFSTGSGVLNMIRQTGMALGVAVLVALVGNAHGAEAMQASFALAWWLMVGSSLLGLIPCLFLRQRAE